MQDIALVTAEIYIQYFFYFIKDDGIDLLIYR